MSPLNLAYESLEGEWEITTYEGHPALYNELALDHRFKIDAYAMQIDGDGYVAARAHFEDNIVTEVRKPVGDNVWSGCLKKTVGVLIREVNRFVDFCNNSRRFYESLE